MTRLTASEKDRNMVMRLMEIWIKEYYGEKCKEELPGCPICDAWYAFNILFENESRQVDKH